MMLWINLVGIALIVLIVWWFWLYKEHNISIAEGSLEVLVKDGIYQPAHIKIRANEERQIVFHRADATPCAEMLSIPDLDISERLPLNKKTVISLPALPSGEYAFHCQMQMYKGKITVQ
ncbi:cupredoxin-like protein [Alteromonas sp. 76-1]|jgi:plastocyanin domain-containing protein|uniref:cupredoxin domain-containing protein n=1 Tax=unclassified Alteromonas TaxID=2614992 RepID=UPI000A810D0A|nr:MULTISPECIES: cupredoxin domain-containing protein [unclassified Alteromonas]VEL97199.1 cupredoxin-like protein [Alteromonas sp. 76-1]|tara:strand:+ start:471 stop:827 length:357 start_codon:yes stop_codon:yes gene_type:complete